MLNKYMKMDPFPWLTDGENPAVTYLVKSEVLKLPEADRIYNELIESNLTDYFKRNLSKGILGDADHPDLYERGSVWFYLYAAASGYKNTSDIISTTADYLCSRTQLDNGGFCYGFKSSDAVGCRTGNMVYSLLKSGVSDSRTYSGLNWIIKNQRSDGGWLHCPFAGFCDVIKLIFLNSSGNGLKYENDQKISSCPVASYSCLKALVQAENNDYNDTIKKASEFFINNNFFINSVMRLRCGNNVNYNKAGYPLMSQYDYLSGLVLVSETGNFENSLFGELFNHIIKKQNIDGSWDCENTLHGMIKEKKGKSRWVTLNAVKFINKILDREN